MRKKIYLSILLCLLFVPLHAIEPFKFALVTDMHINPSSPTSIEDLQNSVQQINQTDSLDFVLVTGDITDDGDCASLLIAKKILDQLNIKYYIIMGNHETKWSESGMTDYQKIFGPERVEFEHKGFLFLGFNSGPFMRMALGHISPQDITWLKNELKAKAGNNKPVILFTHYPLLPGDVDNWYDVTDAVRSYNIRTFLGGHYHANRRFSYDGIPGIINRSNLRGKDKTGGYSIYHVTKDSILVYEQLINKPMHEWTSLSLKKNYYSSKPGSSELRPDFSMNNNYKNIKEKWLLHTGTGIYNSPVLYKGRIYVGDDQGTMTCYSLSGKKQWIFQSGLRIVGTPAAANGIIVFGSADKNIYGLNARTGKKRWMVTADAPVLGAVTISQGIAYIGASDHTFRAIRVNDGTVVWAYHGVKGYIETKPLITDEKVIFGAWDNTLYALNRENGKELWKWKEILKDMHYSPAAVWPVAAKGKVFITDPQRAITAIDLNTGATVWRTYQSMVRETIALSADHKKIYSKTMNDSIVCYAVANSPHELWASDVGFGYEHAPSMPVEKGGILFGSTKNGLVFALDTETGRVIWQHKIGNSLINTVVPINRRQVIFTETDGSFGLLENIKK
ncbi:MAG: PQQ-binding-like beta-propeller repeat protein [Bacteroidaceae bacterium]|nr:PQQ-binding-like beta-propeller repeat protein [Bacteroidaceae bacterium]